MAAAAILKNLKIAIFRQRFDRSPRNLARWCSSNILKHRTIKNEILKIQDGGGRHLEKIENSPNLRNGLTIRHEIRHVRQFRLAVITVKISKF